MWTPENIVKFLNRLQADLFICRLAMHDFFVFGAQALVALILPAFGGGEFCRAGCRRQP
jgi:hypothetical protein